MGIGHPPPGLLVEGLIVPDAHAVGPQKGCCHPPQDWIEAESAHVQAILPEVDALYEALLVDRFVLERAAIVPGSCADRAIYGIAVTTSFLLAENILDEQEAITLEGLDLDRGQPVALHESHVSMR